MSPETKQEEKVTEAPEKTPEKVEAEKTVELPKGDFFSGDNMERYIEQAGLKLYEDEPAPVASDGSPAPEKKEEEDCPDCPGGKKETAPPPAPEKKVEPFATFSVGGKTYEFQTKEEFDQARSILGVPSKESHEPAPSDATLSDLGKYTTQIVNLNKEEPRPEEEELDEELLSENPALANLIKSQKEKMSLLERELVSLKGDKMQRDRTEQEKVLENLYNDARRTHEFEDVIDKNTGENVTVSLFSGAFLSDVVSDAKKAMAPDGRSFDQSKIKSHKEYMEAVASRFALLDKHYKAKYSGNGSTEEAEPITADSIKENHPEIFKEIGELWFADRTKKQEEITTPSIKSERPDASPEKKTKKGERRTLNDWLSDAENDPELRAELGAGLKG